MRTISRGSIAIVLLIIACSESEEYGFVARLGNDTTSIEHVTRTEDRIISDVVERSPRVIRKRWEATFNDDGSLRRWTMDKQILNPRPDEAARVHFGADIGADSALITERSGDSTRSYVVKDIQPVTVPWESYVYGLYELLFAAALQQPGDSVPVKQYQPGRGLLRGVVRKYPNDSLTFVTGGLAGTGVARVDADGRMQMYSGKHTTFKHETERVRELPDMDAIAQRFAEREKAAPARSLSARDTTKVTLGPAVITLDYSRPLRRGRDVLGSLVPYGAVWRTGANAATQLSNSAPIAIAGVDMAPGTYTVWTLPSPDGVQLIINKQHGQWGTRYNPQMDLARVALQTETLDAPIDTFTIRIAPGTASTGTLFIEWDRFRWSAPVVAR